MSLLEHPPSSPAFEALPAEQVVAYLSNPELSELVHLTNDHYYYWTEVRRRPIPAAAQHQLLWAVARALRRQSAWILRFTSNTQAWSFSYNLPQSLQQVIYALDQRLGGERGSSYALLSGQERGHLLVNSRMEEAIASSQMEGASTTREMAKQLLRTRRKPLNRSERMIVNNYQTMRHLQEIVHRPLTVEALLEIQVLVTKGTLDQSQQVGSLRTTDTIFVVDHTTSEAVHYPPDHHCLPDLLRQFCALANDDSATHHPLVQASILHFLLGFIHPFADGNGRTARAIFYWFLLRKNYWLVEYMPLSRIIKRSVTRYGQAYLFAEADGNDMTYFLKYQLQVLQQAYSDLELYMVRQRQQANQARQLLVTGELNQRQVQILGWLMERPETMLTIRDVQHRFGVVYDTARTDLMHLETLGLLDKRREGKVKILYLRAADFEEAVARLKGGR